MRAMKLGVVAGVVLLALWFVFHGAAPLKRLGLSATKRAAREARDEFFTQKRQDPSNGYADPSRIASLEGRDLRECSGIVASRLNSGVIWTHNDSGDGPYLYAYDRRGKRRGIWRVAGAGAVDWEDIATGPGPRGDRQYLYIGDIGDNTRRRNEIAVYRVPEPSVGANANPATKKSGATLTETAEIIRLKYPDGAHDAETLLVHPRTGDLYIITKTLDADAGVYKLAAPLGAGRATLTRIGALPVSSLTGGLLTGGDISPDGRRTIFCDYLGGYELILPDGAASFDAIWKQSPKPVALGARRQGEAVCYSADGESLLATSEGAPTPLIEIARRRAAR